jgi:hypothetical protein
MFTDVSGADHKAGRWLHSTIEWQILNKNYGFVEKRSIFRANF